MLQQTWGFGQGPPKKLIPVDYQITISVGLTNGNIQRNTWILQTSAANDGKYSNI